MAKQEKTAGFAIDCGSQAMIEDFARERFRESAREGDDFKKLAVDSGYMTADGEITDAGWVVLNDDTAKIERNCLAWLKKNFPGGVRGEGHDGHGDLIGTLWWSPRSKKQRELLELGQSERIDFVDASYGDLYKTVYNGTSGFSIVLYGSITFFDTNLDDDE